MQYLTDPSLCSTAVRLKHTLFTTVTLRTQNANWLKWITTHAIYSTCKLRNSRVYYITFILSLLRACISIVYTTVCFFVFLKTVTELNEENPTRKIRSLSICINFETDQAETVRGKLVTATFCCAYMKDWTMTTRNWWHTQNWKRG